MPLTVATLNGNIYQYDGGRRWRNITFNFYPSYIPAMCVYKGSNYVLKNWTPKGPQGLYRLHPDGWHLVQAFYRTNASEMSMCVYRGLLFMSAPDPVSFGNQLYSYDGTVTDSPSSVPAGYSNTLNPGVVMYPAPTNNPNGEAFAVSNSRAMIVSRASGIDELVYGDMNVDWWVTYSPERGHKFRGRNNGTSCTYALGDFNNTIFSGNDACGVYVCTDGTNFMNNHHPDMVPTPYYEALNGRLDQPGIGTGNIPHADLYEGWESIWSFFVLKNTLYCTTCQTRGLLPCAVRSWQNGSFRRHPLAVVGPRSGFGSGFVSSFTDPSGNFVYLGTGNSKYQGGGPTEARVYTWDGVGPLVDISFPHFNQFPFDNGVQCMMNGVAVPRATISAAASLPRGRTSVRTVGTPRQNLRLAPHTLPVSLYYTGSPLNIGPATTRTRRIG